MFSCNQSPLSNHCLAEATDLHVPDLSLQTVDLVIANEDRMGIFRSALRYGDK